MMQSVRTNLLELLNSAESRLKHSTSRLKSLHGDQEGSISIISVFSIIFLAMVLGMIMNVGRHADRKLRIQNGADASAYTGGIVLARGMNTLAFTNHLLGDVFAVTAYLREGRDRNSEELSYEILDAWIEMAPDFATAPSFTGWQVLSTAIPGQAELERELIRVFSDQNEAVSAQLLPVMESILDAELIPEFQRILAAATPRLANISADEIAGRHGPAVGGLSGGVDMAALMWRTDGEPFDSAVEAFLPTLPAADPILDETEFQPLYFTLGLRERNSLARRYLDQLNNTMLSDFDRYAPLSQFESLWRGLTRDYLSNLLAEYPDSNLTYQLRRTNHVDPNDYIEDEYHFIGVAYWNNAPELLPGAFVNPRDADDVAFAQVRLYIPRNRLIWDPTIAIEPTVDDPFPEIYRQSATAYMSLLNQRWTVQLVPATSRAITGILEGGPPPDYGISVINPNFGGVSVDEFQRLNTH